MLLNIISRMQFGFTISFHILFPAFSIGLILFIAILEATYLKTGKQKYRDICKFWTKILALTFGMGIVSGIVMEFQLGTNWSEYTRRAGSVLGVLFTYEVMTAFFIEAGVLGILFFGWERVSPRIHFIATLLACFGVTLSAFWIMAANSWMQAPSGVTFDGTMFHVTNWLDAIFSPLFMPRYLHMMLSTYIATLMAIAGISAHYLLQGKHLVFARTCFSFVMWALLILLPMQIFLGDEVGMRLNTHQPLKTAAIEGIWDTQKGAPLILFALPNSKTESNDFAISIPHGASLINTHQWNGEMLGLKSVPPNDRPVVFAVFWSFRVMVGLGLLILLTALIALYLRLKNKLFNTKWFLRACMYLSPAGFVSIITGWFVAELGRQPWIIYNYLRTVDAQSPVSLYQVIMSLAAIVIVYGIIFGYFYFHYFLHAIAVGPVTGAEELDQSFFYMSPSLAKEEKDKKK